MALALPAAAAAGPQRLLVLRLSAGKARGLQARPACALLSMGPDRDRIEAENGKEESYWGELDIPALSFHWGREAYSWTEHLCSPCHYFPLPGGDFSSASHALSANIHPRVPQSRQRQRHVHGRVELT